MRQQGRITKWNDERGFGFISTAKGDRSVFVHISSITRGDRRPAVNDAVSYTPAFDSHGRPRAADVRFMVDSRSALLKHPNLRLHIALPCALAICFLVLLAALAAVGRLESSWLAIYYGASIITYGGYSRDKTAAQNAGRRIPELTLHLMSLAGGWPGALIAQVLLRHKTRKTSFVIGYWFTVIINCIALGVIIVNEVSPVKVFLGATV